MSRRAFCARCGEPIQWVLYPKTKSTVPLMDSSDPAGDWAIIGGVAHHLSPAEAAHHRKDGGLVFKIHPTNCVRKGTPCPDHLRPMLGLKPRGERGSR